MLPKASQVDVADLRFSSAEFVSMLGVSISTLKRWERNGLFVPGRFPNGTKFYTTAHLEVCLGHGQTDDSYRVFIAGRIRTHLGAGRTSQDALKQANAEWRAEHPLDVAVSGTKKVQTASPPPETFAQAVAPEAAKGSTTPHSSGDTRLGESPLPTP